MQALKMEPYYHGDCLEILSLFEDEGIQLAICDPPYSINTKSDGSGKLNPWADYMNSALFYKTYFEQIKRITYGMWNFFNWRSFVVFQKAACDINWPMTSLMIWDKIWIGPGGPYGLRPRYEMIGLWLDGMGIKNRSIPDIFQCMWTAKKPHGHPAEKPVELVKFLIDILDVESVIDPFNGSGTTAEACVELGKKYIGIEMDERWLNVTIERLEKL